MEHANYAARCCSGTVTIRTFQSIFRIRGLKGTWPGGRLRLPNDLCHAEARHDIDEDHFAPIVSYHFLAPVVAALGEDLGHTRRISSSGVS